MNLTKSRTAKFVAGIAGFAMALSFAVTPVTTSAATIAELQAMIASLTAQLAALSGTTTTTTTGTSFQFNTNLTVGSTGTDVMNLQKVLNSSADTQVASGASAGAPGHETSFFGPATKAAVMKFQAKYGISPVAGYVGPLTRTKLNSMGGTSSTTTTTTTTGGTVAAGSISVSSVTQPVNSLAPKAVSRLPFTKFAITAGASDVTVNSVTVERTGFADDAAFSGIVLLRGDGTQVGNAKTLNSNSQANIGDGFVVKAGTTEVFTVAGNMAASETSYVGQTASINVVAINTSATVTGSLPITGASHTINDTLSIGSVSTSTSAFDPGTTQTKNIGDTSVRISGVKFTANSTEDLKLFSVRWRQVGTASSVDISNVVTKVDGTAYPTTLSTDGKYYTTMFPNGLLITKGSSIDVYIEADITGSNSNLRTVEFDLDKVTDVYFVGQSYGYGIAPSGTYTPWYVGHVTTINAGTVTTIAKANEVAAQNIAVNVSGQVLGGFATNFAGEATSVSGMVFTIATSSASLVDLVTDISVVDSNGAVVAGPVDATWTAGHVTQTVTFTDTVTFPIGRHVYTVKGKIGANAVTGAVIQLKTTPSAWSTPTGETSGATVTIGTTQITMNSMTVKGAALAVNISAQPAAQNVVGGVTNFVLGNYQLDATQSGEDIRLNNFPVIVDATGTWTASDMTGCTLNDGSTPLNTGSRTINSLTDNAKTTFSFDNSLVVAKGTVKTLSLQCNLASSPVATAFQVKYDNTTTDYSITGVTSGNGVTPTFGAATTGGLMTVGNGSLTATVDSSSPGYTLVAGGATGQTTSVFKLRATNENISLTKIGLILTAVTTGNSTNVAGNLTGVNLYNGSTLIGTALFASGATVATSTLNAPLVLTKDTDTYITVKADIADVSVSGSATEGDLVKINLDSTEGTGLSSGVTVSTGAATGVSGVRVFNTFPTIALDQSASGIPTSTGVADGRLMRFKVTADSHGDVGIYKFSFTVATTTLTVRDIGLFAYTDASYSTAMSGNFSVGGTNSGGQVDENVATTSATGICTGATVNTTLAGSTCTSDSSISTLVIKAASNPVEVPAGTTRYFELRGSITGNATGASVLTKMLADSSAATSTASVVSGNFIWSPNATSTSVFSSNDWTSGYGIVGFPTSGILQSRAY